MIHNRVTVVFQPAGGSAADAINAANQQVFVDLTPGTMTPTRTNASGLLVSASGAAVPMDDSRDYAVLVTPVAPAMPPPATTGTRMRVAAGRLVVQPQIAIHLADPDGRAASRLACTLAIGATNISVTSGSTGWILSNDQTPGTMTLFAANHLLRTSSAPVPSVTLSLAYTPVVRGATARINVVAPAGAVNFRVTEWRYALSHVNPGGRTVTATIARPASESNTTFHQFWEGTMCASGEVRARFVTGCVLRFAGATRVSETVVSMDPQTATLAVTVEARPWRTTLTELPEGVFTAPINRFEDTGRHDWTPASGRADPTSVTSGPNRGCRFIESTTGLAFVSDPRINADVLNLTSPFQSAQGRVYVESPSAVRGQVVPPSLYTVAASGAVHVPDRARLAAYLGVANLALLSVTDECISPADLLANVRTHEYTGPISHKENCLRALRALEPAVFTEALVDPPGGGTLNFRALLNNRIREVAGARLSEEEAHKEVDESATRSAGALRWTSSEIPDVDLVGGVHRTVWNPAANRRLTN